MPTSAIQSSVKRQVLKAILFALPKTMNHTASRVPAFRERLKQRDLIAWIGLTDGNIGRIVAIKGGKFQSRSGPASEAQVVMAKDMRAPARKSATIALNSYCFVPFLGQTPELTRKRLGRLRRSVAGERRPQPDFQIDRKVILTC